MGYLFILGFGMDFAKLQIFTEKMGGAMQGGT
jgi:hypothetical protein